MNEKDSDSESSRSTMSFCFRPTLGSYAYVNSNSLRATTNDSHTDDLYHDSENEDSDAGA